MVPEQKQQVRAALRRLRDSWLAETLHRMSDTRTATELGGWIQDLVCPVCFSALRFSDAEVVCVACGRNYPMVDGIPVLIAERATLQK